MKQVATIVLLCGMVFAQSQSGNNAQLAIRPGASDANEQHIAKEVRHELAGEDRAGEECSESDVVDPETDDHR